MNIQDMMTDLCRLDREWERNCYSPDLTQQKEWTQGVWYGVRLVLSLAQRHAHIKRKTPRVQMGHAARIFRSLGPVKMQ
jgi:Ni,Fe-hydrogenase I cytochrome b subunit